MKLIYSFLATLFFTTTFAATDTVYFYFNKDWEKCTKDSAAYVSKKWKQDSVWKRRDYWAQTNVLAMEADYVDEEMKTKHGLMTWYDVNGVKHSTAQYDHGKELYADHYYENGQKKGHIAYGDNGKATAQTGWDESGNEIKDYIVEQEATFPGGIQGWIKYLQKNLNANVAAESGARKGSYKVKVKFIVDKDGSVSDVHTTEETAGCKLCGKEAERVIAKGPKWIPAIQYNKQVKFTQIQAITFVVNAD